MPISLLALLIVVGATSSAFGCPLCATDTGAAVRAGIAVDAGPRLLAVLAPFPALIAVVAWLHRGRPDVRTPR